MSEVKISAETRNEFGKGAARRIRRDSKSPVSCTATVRTRCT